MHCLVFNRRLSVGALRRRSDSLLAEAYLEAACGIERRLVQVSHATPEMKAPRREEYRQLLRKNVSQLQRQHPGIRVSRSRNVSGATAHLRGRIIVRCFLDGKLTERFSFFLKAGKRWPEGPASKRTFGSFARLDRVVPAEERKQSEGFQVSSMSSVTAGLGVL
jgi:hypothetical protein